MTTAMQRRSDMTIVLCSLLEMQNVCENTYCHLILLIVHGVWTSWLYSPCCCSVGYFKLVTLKTEFYAERWNVVTKLLHNASQEWRAFSCYFVTSTGYPDRQEQTNKKCTKQHQQKGPSRYQEFQRKSQKILHLRCERRTLKVRFIP